MSTQSTLRQVSDALVRLFAPLRDATTDIDAFQAFFLRLGWAVGDNAVPAGYLTLADDVLDALTIAQSLTDDPGLNEVEPVFKAVKAIHDDLLALAPPSGVTASAEELVGAIVDILVADFLVRELPQVWSVLRHLGLTETLFHPSPDGSTRPAFVSQRVLWSDLPQVLSDPASIPRRVYGWGGDTFDFSILAGDLFHALSAFDVHARVRRLGADPSVAMEAFVEDPDQMRYGRNVALDVILVDTATDDAEIEIGVSLLALPAEGAHQPGMVVRPLVPENLADTIQLNDNLDLVLKGSADLTTAFGVVVRPGETPFPKQPFTAGATPLTGDASVALETTFDTPVVLLGSPSASRLDVAGLRAAVEFLASTKGTFEARFNLGFNDVSVVLEASDADGFIGSVLGTGEKKATFSFGLRWSTLTGLSFSAAGGFAYSTPINLSLGPVHFSEVELGIAGKQRPSGAGELAVTAGVAMDAQLGPVTAVVDGIGVELDIAFESGNAGPFDIAAGFKPPTGVGISVNAGSVSGGGFISFDPDKGRYFGALELSVYGVAVKAFAIIETKVPGVSFSFLIIISAEFTPIQLGLGFTLNGVGGIAGINRMVDAKGLLDAVRSGRLENVLFPHDVVHDAPAIVHDVGVLFPPAASHYVFGPLAKIGWGTPTLVEAELGLVLELPGPRLVILGTVHAALPTKEDPIVELNLDVGGLIDFPKKYFALDASLHDSRVGDFPVSGDMSMRLTWGSNPNFALAVGGFNPHYNPPPSFPKLRPVTVDLGEHGNPSINLHGYMALTSNTAQVGAQLEVRVSGGGADLYGFLGFDALFVFSPFSFMADIEGGVSVSFHGHGFSLNFHGHISGPSPWHLDGKVCVSILFWDACVGFSVNLGGASRPTLPGLDPWDGTTVGNVQTVLGLMEAIADVKNWAGGAPPASTNVVTLVAAPPNTPAPVDPLGSATLRQKVVPLQLPVTRFAGTKPRQARTFDISQITIGQTITPGQDPATVVTVSKDKLTTVSDFFAPGEYQDLKAAQKLSSPSFVQMAAGVTFSSDAVDSGQVDMKGLTYHTIVLNADGTESDNDDYTPTSAQVTSTTSISAAALAGIRAAALGRFVDPTALPKVSLNPDGYVLSSTSTLKVAPGFNLGQPVPRPVAFGALLSAALTDPTAPQSLQVTPVFNALP